MTKLLKLAGWIMVFLIGACDAGYEEPETAIDAGRQFISAIYNGNFKRAGQLVVPEGQSRLILSETIEKDFRARDGFGKEALSKASIRIMEIKTIDTATTLLYFTNAYSQKMNELEIKKSGGLWRVNLEKMVKP